MFPRSTRRGKGAQVKILHCIPPERHFLRALASAFIGEARRREDPWRQPIVLFPSRRAGLFFRRYLGVEAKSPFLLPRIYAFDDFITECVVLYDTRPLMPLLEQVWELYHVVRDLGEHAAILRYHVQRFDRFIPWGIWLVKALEEIDAEGKSLPNQLPTGTNHYDTATLLGVLQSLRWKMLTNAGKTTPGIRLRTFLEAIHRGEKPPIMECGEIHMVGLLFLRRVEEVFLRSCNADVTIWLEAASQEDLPPKTLKKLREIGVDLSTLPPFVSPRAFPTLRLVEVPDRHHALSTLRETLATSLKLSPSDEPDHRAIIVPYEDALIPLLTELEQLTEEHSLEINVTMGYPLQRSLVASFALNLVELHLSRDGRRYPLSLYLRLLRHPYVTKWLLHAVPDVTVDAVTTIEYTLSTLGSPYMDTGAIEEAVAKATAQAHASEGQRKRWHQQASPADTVTAALQRFHEHVLKPLSLLSEESTVGDVCEVLEGTLRAFAHALFPDKTGDAQGATSAKEDSPYYRRSIEEELFFTFLEEVIVPLRAVRWARAQVMGLTTVHRLLRETVKMVRLPFSGDPLRGLQIMGFFESNLLSFSQLFLLDVNEGILPPTEKPNPLFPEHLKRMVSARVKEQELISYRHIFMRLLRSSRECTLFFHSPNSQKSSRGSILDGGAPRSRFIEELIWQMNSARGGVEESIERIPIVIPRSVLQRRDNVLKEPSVEERLTALLSLHRRGVGSHGVSATMLNTYLRCAVMFFFRSILAIHPTEKKIKEGLEIQGRRDLGSILHKVLEHYLRGFCGKEFARRDGAAEHRIIERIFEEFFESSDLAQRVGVERRFFLEETARYRLSSYVRWLCEEYAPFHVLRVEESLSIPFSLNHERLPRTTLIGSIDLILWKDRALHIVDYKTGTPPSPRLPREIPSLRHGDDGYYALRTSLGDIQLPFYAFLMLRHGEIIPTLLREVGETPTDTVPLYAQYHPLGSPRHERYEKKCSQDMRAVESKIEAIIAFLLRHMVESKAFQPTDDENVCSRCDYQTICPCCRV